MVLHRCWDEDGRKDQHVRHRVDEASRDQEDEDDRQHEDERAVHIRYEPCRHLLRDANAREHPAEDLRRRNDQHDARRTRDAGVDDPRDLAEAESLVDEHAYDEAVEATDGGRLRRREDAGVDAAEDDERRDHRPHRAVEAACDLPEGGACWCPVVALADA